MSVKSSIGWCSMTLNPIKGLCPMGCRLPDGRIYCYYSGELGFAQRFFKRDPELRLDLSVFSSLPKTPKRIFLCSTNDYWGDWIPDEWREAIRKKTEQYPQHTFQLLTKQPQNLSKYSPYPDNWWVGVTITNNYQVGLANLFFDRHKVKAKIRFISFEPLLEEIKNLWGIDERDIQWVIIGRLTGFGHRYDPEVEWIENIVKVCKKSGIPVYLKENLKQIWKGKLIQEIPKL